MDYAIGQVRLHLTAVIKCSFKSPPETQNALGVALAAGHSSQAASSAIDDLLGLGLPAAVPATPSPQLKLNTKATPGSKHISAEVAPIASCFITDVSPQGIVALMAP
ncbi:beta-adaptin-like protein A [Gossypium australe]|uniref:Beta-adaptin-like protein A n=1 Tax=Gossypium australe TaxID=47621 RepID=A0A5B6W8W8_9ROSI|nr:beta-adaptin-like protein A [Gossypium australe]